MIQFTCTYCQAKLSVPEDKAGQIGKCPKCARTIRVPAATKGHAPLMPPGGARERVEDGEIPLADETPRARTAEPARHQPPRPRAGEELGEIPMADEPEEKAMAAAPAQEATAGGLVITPAGDALVVTFQNAQILDSLVIETIGQELYALTDQRACRKIVLDFSNVRFLSSQMLGVLMSLQKKSVAIKGRLLLCALQPDLQKVFHIVKLERVLPIVADRQTALRTLSQP